MGMGCRQSLVAGGAEPLEGCFGDAPAPRVPGVGWKTHISPGFSLEMRLQ